METIHFPLPLGGRVHDAELGLPRLGDVVSLWMEPRLRTPERNARLQPAEVRRFLTAIDGAPVSPDVARAIAADRQGLATYRRVRDGALAATTEGGMVFARCPHCDTWEADLLPVALAVGLRTAFAPVVGSDGHLAVPMLGKEWEPPARGGHALTSALSFVLPRLTSERGGFARAGGHDRFEHLRARALEVLADSDEDWDEEAPGFIAMLRLGALVSRLPGHHPGSIESLAALSLSDFLFIDNVWYLTHCVSLPEHSPLVLTCERCSGRYVPLGSVKL